MTEPQPPAAPESPCLTARQAAAYLHLNEKKLYELANTCEIPAARVGGKWLFPRKLLDDWLLEQAHGGVFTDRLLIAGGDDPLLSAAVRRLTADLGEEALIAYSPTGTRSGLEQLARRRVDACLLHWGDAAHSATQHRTLVSGFPGHTRWTLVRLALREQGVLLRRGLGIDRLETLAAYDLRWTMRPAGSGAGHLLASALADLGFRPEDCGVVAIAPSEPDAAAFIVRGVADCAPGSRATAAEFGLDFLPLAWEALDLALPREIFFRNLLQNLLACLDGRELRGHATRLGGYDLSPLGRIQG